MLPEPTVGRSEGEANTVLSGTKEAARMTNKRTIRRRCTLCDPWAQATEWVIVAE
jgi:hypothetical protein